MRYIVRLSPMDGEAVRIVQWQSDRDYREFRSIIFFRVPKSPATIYKDRSRTLPLSSVNRVVSHTVLTSVSHRPNMCRMRQ